MVSLGLGSCPTVIVNTNCIDNRDVKGGKVWPCVGLNNALATVR